MIISLLLPSRGRPDGLDRFIHSALMTADSPAQLEIVVRLDDDDESKYDNIKETYRDQHNIKWVSGPRVVLSECWNDAYKESIGDILGHMGDDIIFRTSAWDEAVREEFRSERDRILFVHGDDGGHPNGKTFGTHGFISRAWVNTVGYFVPPYFSSDYNDTWLNDVANMLGRRRFVPILTEHMHPVHNKGDWDLTHRERLDRHRRDNVDQLYKELDQERIMDAAKLNKYIISRTRP